MYRLKAQLGNLALANGVYRLLIFTAALGVSFCAAGLYLFLAGHLGRPGAAVSTGIALLSLAGIPCAFLAGKLRQAPPKSSESTANPEQVLKSLLGDRNLDELIRDNSTQAVLGALAAGVMAGASPKARQGLLRLLEEFSEKSE